MLIQELLRHVADNLEAGRTEWHGLLFNGASGDHFRNYSWEHANLYTLAPRTHIVNGFEVPAPLSVAPGSGLPYFLANLTLRGIATKVKWWNDKNDELFLSRKLCFSTEEDALQNGLALLGYDPATTQVGDV